eukprot:4905871-Amphidinium_carterae.1
MKSKDSKSISAAATANVFVSKVGSRLTMTGTVALCCKQQASSKELKPGLLGCFLTSPHNH